MPWHYGFSTTVELSKKRLDGVDRNEDWTGKQGCENCLGDIRVLSHSWLDLDNASLPFLQLPNCPRISAWPATLGLLHFRPITS